jgi:hypothetical protein
MKLILTKFWRYGFSFIICVLIAGNSYSLLQKIIGAAIIEIDEIGDLDFGILPAGETRTKSICIRNAGSQVLEIKEVKLSCGCTQASISKKTIPPGDKADLTISLSGRKDKGRGSVEVLIVSNASIQIFPLRLKYTAFSGVYTEPSYIDFGRINIDNLPSKKRIKLLGLRTMEESEFVGDLNEEVNTVRIECEDPFLNIIAPTSPLILHVFCVELSENAPAGEFRSLLNVIENEKNENRSLQTIEIYGSVRGSFFCTPASIYLRYSGNDTDKTHTEVRIVSRDNTTDFKILSATISQQLNGLISVVIDDRTENSYKNLRVRANSTTIVNNRQAEWFSLEKFGYVLIEIEFNKQLTRLRLPVEFDLNRGV